jgi:hypothetical protein
VEHIEEVVAGKLSDLREKRLEGLRMLPLGDISIY